MFDTLALPELQQLVTADGVKELEQATRFDFQTALRAAAGCHEVVQTVGSYGDGEETACALSAGFLVASRLGYLK